MENRINFSINISNFICGISLHCCLDSRNVLPRGSSKKKLVPLPNWLLRYILPSKIFIRPFTIESPKPVPPYFLLIWIDPWEKLSNICSCFSFEMPIPLSWISKLIWYRFFLTSAFLTLTQISPSLVNFMAFPNKLIKIWEILSRQDYLFSGAIQLEKETQAKERNDWKMLFVVRW